jgi:hypothetical protein
MSSTVETVTKEATDEVNQLADQDVDTVDTNARYAAYGARLRTALRASTRYVAYVREARENSNHVTNGVGGFDRRQILVKHFDRK